MTTMALLPASFDLIRRWYDGAMLLPCQRAHILRYGAPNLDRYLKDQLDQAETTWYDFLYKADNTFDADTPCVPLNEVATLAQIRKDNAVTQAKKMFGELNLTSQVNSPQGIGRPETIYFLTLNQAKEFMMTGNTDRCKILRSLFAKLSTATSQFIKMQAEYEKYQSSLHTATHSLIDAFRGKQGIVIGHNYSKLSDTDGIDVVITPTDNFDETFVQSNKTVSVLKFIETEEPNEVLQEFQRDNAIVKLKKQDGNINLSNDDMGALLLKTLTALIREKKQRGAEAVNGETQLKIVQTQLQIEQTKLEQLRLRQGQQQEEAPVPPPLHVVYENDLYHIRQFCDTRLRVTTYNTATIHVYMRYQRWHTTEFGQESDLSHHAFRRQLVNNNLAVEKVYCNKPNQSKQFGLIQRRVL